MFTQPNWVSSLGNWVISGFVCPFLPHVLDCIRLDTIFNTNISEICGIFFGILGQRRRYIPLGYEKEAAGAAASETTCEPTCSQV
jgi:hypothetical protein